MKLKKLPFYHLKAFKKWNFVRESLDRRNENGTFFDFVPFLVWRKINNGTFWISYAIDIIFKGSSSKTKSEMVSSFTETGKTKIARENQILILKKELLTDVKKNEFSLQNYSFLVSFLESRENISNFFQKVENSIHL